METICKKKTGEEEKQQKQQFITAIVYVSF